MTAKYFSYNCGRLDTRPECDEQTDGQNWHISVSLSKDSCNKNALL